jgi:molecular chaperone DnaK (HSP70)
MSDKFAIDFGTTNSVIARWNDGTAELLTISGLSAGSPNGRSALIPSLLYVQDGRTGQAITGQSVRAQGMDRRPDNRLFRNFKRGIATVANSRPRTIDGTPWHDADAAQTYIHTLLAALPHNGVEQLVLTAPVAAFDSYLEWLATAMTGLAAEHIQIVDESTAAALGYAVTEPGAVVLVFDFGGGTLDLSLVQLPESRAETGGFLRRLRGDSARRHTAKVIAKAGRVLGGSDVDHWLLAHVLEQTGLSRHDLGDDYTALLTLCEKAKIELSSAETTELSFQVNSCTYTISLTRSGLETLLEHNGFYAALRRVMDQVMHLARRRGIFKEDIHNVLLVGGMSLMPSVQQTLRAYFTDQAVRADKPFTAVVEGALQVVAGLGLDDFLAHSYGLRYLDPHTGAHRYDELIPAGSPYPLPRPVEVILSAAHDNQATVEFVIGQIETGTVSMVEVKYEDGQAVFVAQTQGDAQQVDILESPAGSPPIVTLQPPGRPGVDRLRAHFTLDPQRHLHLTVHDLLTHKDLLSDTVIGRLK